MANRYSFIFILTTVLSSNCFSQSFEFKHSAKADVLYKRYQAARSGDQASLKTDVQKIHDAHDKEFSKIHRTLIQELTKLQTLETKAGHLDAAVEIRDSISTTKPITSIYFTPTSKSKAPEVYANLVGTSWQIIGDPSKVLTFNSDFSISGWWGNLPSMWTLLPDGTVKLNADGRTIQTIRFPDDYREAYYVRPDGSTVAWHLRRVN
ncbi:MAG: hypothetical protein COA78_08335 [Blastopirellula sp.]|nr:MAG: hypothetical protein COA78_08335 [Blastopirellula sp.]